MVKRTILCLLTAACICSLSAWGRTVAYWQLDGASDNQDAVDAHYPDYIDLTAFGTVVSGDSQTGAAAFEIPNPSQAGWRLTAGDGEPETSRQCQVFGGGSGWYTPSIVEDLRFDNDQSFTVEFWFKTSGAGQEYIVGNRHALSEPNPFSGWQLWTTAGGANITLYAQGGSDANEYLVVTTPLTRNTWQHAALVWDHDDGTYGSFYLYLDGDLKESAAGKPSWNGVTGGPWGIAQRNLWINPEDPNEGSIWGNSGFPGNIDEIRYVDEALMPEQFLNGTTPYSAPQDEGFWPEDLSKNREVDLPDIQKLVLDWLRCTKPEEPGCENLLQ